MRGARTPSPLDFNNRIWTAPLAGVTDKAFRKILEEMEPGLIFTEMVSAKALVYANQKTLDLVDLEGERGQRAVQVFGHEPEILAQAARLLVERGVTWIDLNMGCPAPKIVKNGEGAALMLKPDQAYRAVDALLGAVDIPISVKLRKGFDEDHVNALDMGRRLDKMGISALTLHGRTRSQFYSGQADWSIIKALAQEVDTFLVGNGDLLAPTDGQRILEETGCDGLMLARGILGNPWLIDQTRAVMEDRPPTFPDIDQVVDLAKRHLALAVSYKGERIAVKEMRKHLAWYIKRSRGAARLREKLNQAQTEEEMRALLDDYARGIRRKDGQG